MKKVSMMVLALVLLVIFFSAPSWADTSYAPPTLPTGPYGITFQVKPPDDPGMDMAYVILSDNKAYALHGYNFCPTDVQSYISQEGHGSCPLSC